MIKYIFKCFIEEKGIHIEKYCLTEKEVLQNYFSIIGDIRSCFKIFAEYKKTQNLEDNISLMKYVFGFKYCNTFNYLVIKQEEVWIGTSFSVEAVKIKDPKYTISVDSSFTPTISFHVRISEEEHTLLSQSIGCFLSSMMGAPTTKATMTEILRGVDATIKQCMRW